MSVVVRPDLLAQVVQALRDRDSLLALLGTGDAQSIYPRLDDPNAVPPPAADVQRPWLLVEDQGGPATSSITSLTVVRVTAFDNLGQPPWALNAVVADLKQAFRWRRRAGLYRDSGGNAFAQQVAQESAIYVDHGRQQLARYVGVQIGRFLP